MQNFVELYKELCQLIADKIPEVKWIDLWHNQVNFLEEEHQFPTPAVFLNFRIVGTNDIGQKVQSVNMQVDLYLFYETFADTYNGSFNQEDALEFLATLDKLYSILHGSEGTNYSNMRRTGLSSVDTGSSGNLYLQPFECVLTDYGAMPESVDANIEEVEVTQGAAPVPEDEEPGFHGFVI